MKQIQQIEYDETREMIREFSKAFGRPVNNVPTTPSVEDRILLGNLLLEEVLEYITKGLGLQVQMNPLDAAEDCDTLASRTVGTRFQLAVDPHGSYNVVEAADGLGDVNVIIHFNALWEGIDLTGVTNEIHRSNMSKLDENGEPIINGEGPYAVEPSRTHLVEASKYYDRSKPIGKILKGPNYSPPNLLPILGIIPDEEEE